MRRFIILVVLLLVLVACEEERITGKIYIVHYKNKEIGWITTREGLVEDATGKLKWLVGKTVIEFGDWVERKGYWCAVRDGLILEYQW